MKRGTVITLVVSLAAGCGQEIALTTDLDLALQISNLTAAEVRTLSADYDRFRDVLFTRPDLCRIVVARRLAPEWDGGALAEEDSMCTTMLSSCTVSPLRPTHELGAAVDRYKGCGASVGELISCWEPELLGVADWIETFECSDFVVLKPPVPPQGCLVLRDRCRF